MVLPILIVLLSVLADQLTKLLVLHYLPSQGDSFVLLKDVFRFTHVDNTGVAFGLLKDSRWIFMIVSTLAIILILVYMIKEYKKSKLQTIAISLILGGGIGNMIDRIFRGYVIDFLDFCAFPSIWKYVFNVADACVCVGCALLLLYFIQSEVRERRKKKGSKEAENHG